jgi:hypothetical protein
MKGIGNRELIFNLIDKYNNIGSTSHPPAAAAANQPRQPEDFFRFPISPSSPVDGVKSYRIAI